MIGWGLAFVHIIVKVAFSLQVSWYLLFVTGLLGKIEEQSAVIPDVLSLGIPFYGIIVSNAYILMNKRLDKLAMVVVGLAFSIICIWMYTTFLG